MKCVSARLGNVIWEVRSMLGGGGGKVDVDVGSGEG